MTIVKNYIYIFLSLCRCAVAAVLVSVLTLVSVALVATVLYFTVINKKTETGNLLVSKALSQSDFISVFYNIFITE